MKKIALQRGIQFYVSENIEKRVLYSGNELFMDIWEDAFVRIMLQVRWAGEVDSAHFDS